jgi:hypothetical protein
VVAEPAVRVEPLEQVSRVAESWIVLSHLGRRDVGDLAPVRAGGERLQCRFYFLQDDVYLLWLVAPGEVDRQGLAAIRPAQP